MQIDVSQDTQDTKVNFRAKMTCVVMFYQHQHTAYVYLCYQQYSGKLIITQGGATLRLI